MNQGLRGIIEKMNKICRLSQDAAGMLALTDSDTEIESILSHLDTIYSHSGAVTNLLENVLVR